MFDFNKVGNTLNKIENFLTEQKKQKEVEILIQTAAQIFSANSKNMTMDEAIVSAQHLISKVKVKQ